MGKVLFLTLGIIIASVLPSYAADTLDDVRNKYKDFLKNNKMNEDEANALIREIEAGNYDPNGSGEGYNPGNGGIGVIGGGGGGGSGGIGGGGIYYKMK
jgi:hypothetical protein